MRLSPKTALFSEIWLCMKCFKLVWRMDRNRSDRLVHSLACLMPLPSLSPASLCSTSFSIPRSSTHPWNLARCPTGAQKKTSAPTTQTCTNTWANTTRGEWRTPYWTWRPGLSAITLTFMCVLRHLCPVACFPFKQTCQTLVSSLTKQNVFFE